MAWDDEFAAKRKALTEVGVKVEKLLDGAELAAVEARGAKKVLQTHVKNLLNLTTATDAAVGSEIPDLETLKIVKTWLGRAVVATQNFAANQGNLEQQAAGEAAGHRATHDVIQQLVSQNEEKRKGILASIDAGEIVVGSDGELEAASGGRRIAGVRPSSSLKQERLAEDAQESTPVKKKAAPRKKMPVKKKVSVKRGRK